MFQVFIEPCVVHVEPYLVCEHALYEFHGYHRGRLREWRLASNVLMSVALSLCGMVVHCNFG